MTKLALFASGTGSNVFNILTYFKGREDVDVVAVLSNNPNAGALQHAKKFGVDTFVFDKSTFQSEVMDFLTKKNVDVIILAGFLWLIPEVLVKKYEGKILNVHPALLPDYGGRGMYGMRVHKAVIENKEKKSGITIHKVNEKYDEGDIVAQYTCEIDNSDTPESLALKIHGLEKAHFPETIDQFIQHLK